MDAIHKHFARAANSLNGWEYPRILPLQAPVYWDELAMREKYKYPPKTVYIWFLMLRITSEMRSFVHLTESCGMSDAQARQWWDENGAFCRLIAKAEK